MIRRKGKGRPLRLIELSVLIACAAAACSAPPVADERPSVVDRSRRMPDGRWWMTTNLDADLPGSYCYEDNPSHCRRYGRLYTWEAARRGCASLRHGWRLPTNDDWLRLAAHYGGVSDDSEDGGRSAFAALSSGGNSGLGALLGGGRSESEEGYARLDAHGFYWTASERDSATAWFYNFGAGGRALHRHDDGEKDRAFSVRCVRD